MSFSAADPLLIQLMRDLGLDLADSSLLALMPVIILGLAAPVGAWLCRWIYPRMLIVYALGVAFIGVILRSYGDIVGLFTGTFFIGLGLGVTGAVILGIVKELFAHESASVMGIYTACVCIGTAIGGGAAIPITEMLGSWREGLIFWSLPLLIATLAWLELIIQQKKEGFAPPPLKVNIRSLLRQRQAWMITLFYLFRVAAMWMLIVWISTLMHSRGLRLEEAGMVMSLCTLCEIPSALLCAQVTYRLGGLGNLLIMSVPAVIIACWGLLMGPLSWWPFFACLFGLFYGFIFASGMSCIVSAAQDKRSALALSGMAQGIGFIGGGSLAWLGSFVIDFPNPTLAMSICFSSYALLILIFGVASSKGRPIQTKLPPILK